MADSREKKLSLKRVLLTGLLFHVAFLASMYHCTPVAYLLHGSQEQSLLKGISPHLAGMFHPFS